MDFYSMSIDDAVKLLKHCGFDYLAQCLEQAIAKLPPDQQIEAQPEQQQETDPFQAIFDSRGYRFPSNAR